jgi:CubicO group peptidase (beta-lactamase class C family)
MLIPSKACTTLFALYPYKPGEKMRRCKTKYSALFHLLIVLNLFVASCTPSPSIVQVPQTPEATKVTNTPTIPPTSEISEKPGIPSAEIDDRMDKLVDNVPLAGIAIGIHYKDEFYEQGYGLADVESETPVTAQTVFKIASLTKSFTAAAILRLSEEGKLRLDDPISRFLPGTPEVAQNIQVQHLLNHTSGLPDWSMDAAQAALPDPFTTTQAVEYYFSTFQTLESEPGEISSYNNAGYFLLGAIIEHASGMPYDKYFEATFFAPLGLNSSAECGAQSDLPGYHSIDKQLEAARPSNLRLLGGAGALCSTVGDLLKWLDALAHGKTIRTETWEQMIAPTKLSDGQVVNYGFGLAIESDSKGPEISHDGVTAGFSSYFAYYPEHELSIVLLTNTDGFDPPLRAIATSLVSDLLRESSAR